MSEAELPLKGLLIDKGEVFNPCGKLQSAASLEYSIVEADKIKLIASWQSQDQDIFTLSRYFRERIITLRWNLRRKYHSKKYNGKYTHIYLYWSKQKSIDEVFEFVKDEPELGRVLDMMRVYEVARLNLTYRAKILLGIIRRAEEIDYGLLENLTPFHVEEAKRLIDNL